VAQGFAGDDLFAEATATGPFVNFRARRGALYRYLFAATLGAGELIATEPGRGKSICIDYSSPNISKHLAYHHIRSTVIGHALVNMYRALGYRVIGINHLGDWGTTHGMLLAAYHRWRDELPDPLTITELNRLYVRFRDAIKEDSAAGGSAIEDEGRAWFKKLEDGDPEATRLWRTFRDVSLAEFQEVYDALGITFEEVRGESEYMADVPMVLDLLQQNGLLAESDGALVVPLPEGADPDKTPPMLLRKKDGATLYGTRDLAAAMYRWDSYHFERSLYVVDRGQSLHFQQLFATLQRAGKDWAGRCMHVPFGLVRVGGKKTGTRAGNVVLLKDVLAEAERRAVAVVEENIQKTQGSMSPEQVAHIARAVGVGAVVFANLASQREKDVDFAWEQVLSTSGDSGPYIQYAHARCASILRKADIAPVADVDPARLTHDLEWALARKLIEIGEVVHRAATANEPHIVSRYLLDVCAAFSRWYTSGTQDRSLRVLVDDPVVSRARLTLVAATKDVLARGLNLLGMQAPESM
jgi:arginyl-tRNA synthetase